MKQNDVTRKRLPEVEDSQVGSQQDSAPRDATSPTSRDAEKFGGGDNGGGQPDPLSAERPDNGGSGRDLPVVKADANDRILVGAGGKLVVPREDITADTDLGEELDLKDLQTKKIRKPARREFIALNRTSELTTRLLIHKPKADGIEVEHYYIDSGLRSPIREELKEVRVFVYYSFVAHTYALWIVNVTIDNSWYESLQPLLAQPLPFFEKNAIRVISDKPNSRYRVRYKPLSEKVAWPTKSTEELLGEALGPERFINSTDHPIYRDLVDGIELE